MSQKKKIKVRRYNIYSGMEIRKDDLSICVDPAKIVPEVLCELAPDIILISHESMDHLDPIQVYYLQKKRNAKIFCSIAVAVDLNQYYSNDLTFTGSIHVMVPGSTESCKGLMITAEKSIHCDYMLPLIYRLEFLNDGISIVHCIDSLISDEISELSNNTTIGIIPIGIAKGINSESGVEFISKMDCDVYIPNHFTDQLTNCKKIVDKLNLEEKYSMEFVSLDWNEDCVVDLSKIQCKTNCNNSKYATEELSMEKILLNLQERKDMKHTLLQIIHQINDKKGQALQEQLMKALMDCFEQAQEQIKSSIIIVLTMASLYDSLLIDPLFVDRLKGHLALKSGQRRDELKATLLFFIGIYAQQNQSICCLEEVIQNVDTKNDYITYWVVECLGRMTVSKDKKNLDSANALLDIVKVKEIFNSVIVRRKIFWEFVRITKFQPSYSKMFLKFYHIGLSDFNPDVRLLAILCICFLSRLNQMIPDKIFDDMLLLYKDEEDDVRETYAFVVRDIYQHYALKMNDYKEYVKALTKDMNPHVRRAATDTISYVGW